MISGIEFEFLHFLQSIHNPWLDSVMKIITSLGDNGVIWIVTGLGMLCMKKTRMAGLCVLLSLAAGLVIGNLFLKNIIARDRPNWLDSSVLLLIQNPEDYSFPSGHTLAGFEGAVSIWLYNRKWGALALVLAVLIAFSRMYFFVHFPTDILGGMVLGTLIAFLVHKEAERRRTLLKNT